MSGPNTKWKIIGIILAFDLRKGHLRWTISDIANSAKVSRSLIYFHFGKKKPEILLSALSELVETFYGLNRNEQGLTLVDSVVQTHSIYKENPHFASFFQKWRHTDTQISKILIEAEARFEKQLAKAFPKASAVQIKALHGIFHGLVTAPYVDADSIRAAIELLKLKELRSRI